MIWMNQPEPKGFGDSILMAESFAGDGPFLVHAGDTYIDSSHNRHLKMLMNLFEEKDPGAVFLAERVKDPKNYGIIDGVNIGRRLYDVKKVLEKPQKPKSDLAIIPLYVFNPSIFKILREIDRGVDGEYQLTDAVQLMIDSGSRVYAIELGPRDYRLDIGTPDNYWHALNLSHRRLKGVR